jgi:hypothetical protein
MLGEQQIRAGSHSPSLAIFHLIVGRQFVLRSVAKDTKIR